MSELLSIARPLSSLDHRELLSNIPKINHELPEHLSLKWRALGKAAVTLVEHGEYAVITRPSRALLNLMPAEEVLAVVNEHIRQMPTGSKPLKVAAVETDTIGSRRYTSIAYFLDSPEAVEERKRLTALLDDLNGANRSWRDFKPHITIATIEIEAGRDVLEQFEAIRPERLSLQPIQARFS